MRKLKRSELEAAVEQAIAEAPELIHAAKGRLAAESARESGNKVGRQPKMVVCPKCKATVMASVLSRWRKCPHEGKFENDDGKSVRD